MSFIVHVVCPCKVVAVNVFNQVHSVVTFVVRLESSYNNKLERKNQSRGSWANSLTQCGAYDDSHKYSTHCCMEICVLSEVTVSASAHLFQQKNSKFIEQDSNKTLVGLAWSLGIVMAACKQPSVVSTFKDAIHP